MYNVIMQYLNSFLSCSIRNLTLPSLSLLFTIKLIFSPFLQLRRVKAWVNSLSKRAYLRLKNVD